MGIGSANPDAAKLVVHGTGGNENLPSHGYLNGNGAGVAGAATVLGDTSIRASNGVQAQFFRAISDARIKKVQSVSNGAADLATLNQIEITDYTYIDVVDKGNATHKKVIAQQVEASFPQAVAKTVDVIPDIYQKAQINQAWVSLATDLKIGERVRLISSKEEGIYEVLETKDDKFRTEFSPEGEDTIFVFGREVDDFRSVDYEAIAMLNVSATQELALKITQLEAESAAKDQKLEAMDKSLATIKARLTAIEKLLQDSNASSSAPRK